jgi:cyclic pyranopterin phosphate synthase
VPNLLLTRKCVRKCPYCFADQYMSEAAGGFLGWDDYIYVLDFYERNGIRAVSLLGGEPTVHPDAPEMIDYALQRGFDVRVFTSGVMSARTRERVQDVWMRHEPARSVHFIVNANEPGSTPAGELQSQQAFLELAGSRASLSFNIYRADFDLSFAVGYMSRYDLKPVLRLGLAHPIASAADGNAFVGPEQYRGVADRLASFFPLLDANKVMPSLDCGFPPCMFTDAQLGQLLKLRTVFSWTCGPVIDIGPDLQIWPCFPLSHIRSKTLYDFDTLDDVLRFLSTEVRNRVGGNCGIYLQCDDCAYKARQLCSGGCVTYMLPEGALAQVNPGARG